MSKRPKNYLDSSYGGEIELNVMPFIDIFSLLCTFLLFSAAFASIGFIEVQVPFLSNAAPDKKNEPERELDINLDISLQNIVLKTSYTKPPTQNNSSTFANNPAGHKLLHAKLLDLKNKNSKTEKVMVFIDDDVQYDNIVKVLDQVTLKNPQNRSNQNTKKNEPSIDFQLFPKVVFGSVIL